jgi:endogenous inhibitor of DNA gyrase (YacG/DUF329 family)
MKPKQKHRCPICNKSIQWKNNPYRPFCSERCKLIDLGEWAAEKYRIPGKKVEDESKRENSDDT